jgi:hypothetical protein
MLDDHAFDLQTDKVDLQLPAVNYWDGTSPLTQRMPAAQTTGNWFGGCFEIHVVPAYSLRALRIR